jgi:hypothetical protein
MAKKAAAVAKAAKLPEWTVKARCVVIKEFTMRGTQEEAESATGEIFAEQEIDQVDVQVLSVKQIS